MKFKRNIDTTQFIANINDVIYYFYDGEIYSYDLINNSYKWITNPMGYTSNILDVVQDDEKYNNSTYIEIAHGMMSDFLEILAQEYYYDNFSTSWEKVKAIVEGIYKLYDLENSESDFIEKLKDIEAFDEFQEIIGYKE